MALKANFGSFKDILTKYGTIVILADVTIYIMLYEGITRSFFYVDLHIFH